jgi:hypothetical protein
MDLNGHLRQAIAWYGFQAVHDKFQEICKEDYEFLKKFYEVPVPAKVKPAPAQEAPQEKEEEIPRPEKLRADAKVRVVKKPAQEDIPTNNANPVVIALPLTQTVAPPTPPATQVITSAVVQTQHTQHTSGLTDPKDIKKWQKEQEDNKKRELDAQGINPASLLTKENLQKWIVDEKKTFAAVARDHVGLPDSMVSSAAKSYGIQSETSKRRAIIAASKGRK